MRRSVRDAIVGLSLLGGIASFAGSLLWLQGIRLGSNTWKIKADFSNASGLAERAPVTYRGILIGSVGKINITPESVSTVLEIDNPSLILPKPVFAKVVTSSLLGGDVQVALISRGKSIRPNSPLPKSKECPKQLVLCAGETIKGQPLTSISTLTEELERMLQKADQENVVTNLVDSTKQFDRTQKNLDELILQVKTEIERAEPIITNLTNASIHINNILASLDDPETLVDLKETAKSAKSLAKKIDKLGGDMSKVMEDEDLMDAVRSVTIGLGRLFDELYPEQ